MTIYRSPEQAAHEMGEWLHDRACEEAAEREFVEDEAREEWLRQNPDEVPYYLGEEDVPRSDWERQSDRLHERGDEFRPLDYEKPELF